ncbi:hypothetical protein PBS_29120 [Paraburkholderia sp. 2C]
MPTASAELPATTLNLRDALHATYLKLRLRARLRAASTSIICSPRGDIVARNTHLARRLPRRHACRIFRHLRKPVSRVPCGATHCGAPSARDAAHSVVWRSYLRRFARHAAYVNVRNAAIDDIATRCYTFVRARLFVPAYLISFNID